MPASPSTKNYTLGKGKLYFDKYDQATGKYVGERHLGNAPSVTFNIALEALEHYSSQGGLKAKDKKVISQITPKFNFTLDEINADNLALLLMSEVQDVTQAADDDNTTLLTDVTPGMFYDLDGSDVGIFALGYDGGTAIFTAGATLTGDTSNAEATIVQVIGNATSGTLYLKGITGVFTDNEPLSDDHAVTPGAAVANGPAAFLASAVSVKDTDAPATFFVAGTDFTVDSQTGRIRIVPGGAINGTTVKDLTVVFAKGQATYKQIDALSNTELEGRIRFVSDNPVGNQYEMIIWRVSLVPAGDTALIGDDWASFSMEGEILKDAVNHPASPFMKMIVREQA